MIGSSFIQSTMYLSIGLGLQESAWLCTRTEDDLLNQIVKTQNAFIGITVTVNLSFICPKIEISADIKRI